MLISINLFRFQFNNCPENVQLIFVDYSTDHIYFKANIGNKKGLKHMKKSM